MAELELLLPPGNTSTELWSHNNFYGPKNKRWKHVVPHEFGSILGIFDLKCLRFCQISLGVIWKEWLLNKVDILSLQNGNWRISTQKLKATRILDTRLPNPWCWYFLQCWSPRSCPQILDISQIRPENISEINACAWCGRAIWHQIKRNALALTSKFRSKLRTKNTLKWLQFSKWIA